MSIEIKRTKVEISPEKFRLKILAYADPGFGKTSFAATFPNPIFAACETGHMNGLLPIAMKDIAHLEPETYSEFQQFCGGGVPGQEEFDSYIVDSISEMNGRFIKDHALSQVQRKFGDTDKRKLGVPELDDFNTMSELTRRLLAKILDQPKHICVTARTRYYQPAVIDPQNSKNNKAERVGGPDLPGQLSVASTAMFDVVLRGVVVGAFRDPSDAKTRYVKRIWQTETAEKYIAKNRVSTGVGSIFPSEVEFNLQTGSGTFNWFWERALAAYKASVIAALPLAAAL